ncbi:fibronectin type III-like domain-contianing protein [Paenibacillus aquistagni]|uniref:fibronectin type III-like domain-contianing protein n=1 Tax=Paenibacillus aquistagni TaxID=1852522 RepID=UPI0030B8AB9B
MKIELEPHEKKEVVFELEERDFAYYNTKYNRWIAETGYFKLVAGSSSRDIRLTERVFCDFGKEEASFHKFSLLNDWVEDPTAKSVLEKCLHEMNEHVTDKVHLNEEFIGFWGDFPTIKVLQMFGQNWLIHRTPDQVIDELIAEVERVRQAAAGTNTAAAQSQE